MATDIPLLRREFKAEGEGSAGLPRLRRVAVLGGLRRRLVLLVATCGGRQEKRQGRGCRNVLVHPKLLALLLRCPRALGRGAESGAPFEQRLGRCRPYGAARGEHN